MFYNNFDLKMIIRSYGKTLGNLFTREKLQYICFKLILIDREITYDTIYEKGTLNPDASLLKGQVSQLPATSF